jgi:hypothetical protein
VADKLALVDMPVPAIGERVKIKGGILPIQLVSTNFYSDPGFETVRMNAFDD